MSNSNYYHHSHYFSSSSPFLTTGAHHSSLFFTQAQLSHSHFCLHLPKLYSIMYILVLHNSIETTACWVVGNYWNVIIRMPPMILAPPTQLLIPCWQAWMLGKNRLPFFIFSGDLTNHSRLTMVSKEVYGKTYLDSLTFHTAPSNYCSFIFSKCTVKMEQQPYGVQRKACQHRHSYWVLSLI